MSGMAADLWPPAGNSVEQCSNLKRNKKATGLEQFQLGISGWITGSCFVERNPCGIEMSAEGVAKQVK